jgi:hypothetical protein
MRAPAFCLIVALGGCGSDQGPGTTDATVPAAPDAGVTPRSDGSADGSPWGPPVACPADANRGEPCLRAGDTCTVGGACCLCQVVPACSPMLVWTCRQPSTEPTCGGPAPPALMSACSVENQTCYYCTDQTPAARTCARGKWVEDALRVCR